MDYYEGEKVDQPLNVRKGRKINEPAWEALTSVVFTAHFGPSATGGPIPILSDNSRPLRER
jgi:hypothetical protein